MNNNNSNISSLVLFILIAMVGFSVTLQSCGGVSDDIAKHAIDRAFVARAVSEIANGGGN